MRELGSSRGSGKRKVICDPVERKVTSVPGRPLWMPEYEQRRREGRMEIALVATLAFAIVLALVVVGSCALRGV